MTRSLAEIQASVARRHHRRIRERQKRLERVKRARAEQKAAREKLRAIEAEARKLERLNDSRQTFGQAIRAARFVKGWTIGELAYRVGMTRKVVQNLEYGTQSTSRVAAFERELGVRLAGLPFRRAKILIRERAQRADSIRAEAHVPAAAYDRARRSADTGVEEHSHIERELVLGLRIESARNFRGCNACHGMSWRRHWNGCVGCGKPYAPEADARPEIPGCQSSAGYMAASPDEAA